MCDATKHIYLRIGTIIFVWSWGMLLTSLTTEAQVIGHRDLVLKDKYYSTATFAGRSDENTFQFSIESGTRIAVKSDDVIQFGWCVEPLDQLLVFLQDGTRISVNQLSFDQDGCEIKSRLLGKLVLPGEIVNGIIFRPTGIGSRFDEQSKLISRKAKEDTIVFSNGDQIAGKVKSIDLVQSNTVSFLARGEISQFEIDRIDAVIFANKTGSTSDESKFAPEWEIALHDGSVIMCNSWTVYENHSILDSGSFKARITQTGPGEGRFSHFSGIKRIEGIGWLTAMPYARFQNNSPFNSRWTIGINKSVLQNKLRFKSRIYENGLGMQANSSVVYTLDQTFGRFQALLVPDASVDGTTSINCRVLTLSKDNSWSVAVEKKVGGVSDPQPVFIDADIANSVAIALQVLPGNDGEALDRVNWVNPVLSAD